MGKFDGLEDFLSKNKKPLKDDGKENRKSVKKGLFGNSGSWSGRGQEVDQNLMEQLAKIISNEVKGAGDVEVLPSGLGIQITSTSSINSRSKGKDLLDLIGITESLTYIASAAGVKVKCCDVAGTELEVGDILKMPGGEEKKVMAVGYMFCGLSRTDDLNKADGIWFEAELKLNNFIKK